MEDNPQLRRNGTHCQGAVNGTIRRRQPKQISEIDADARWRRRSLAFGSYSLGADENVRVIPVDEDLVHDSLTE